MTQSIKNADLTLDRPFFVVMINSVLGERLSLRNYFSFILFLLINLNFLFAESISVMNFNVENLFDPYDDPNKRDEEFTPEGKLHWTIEKLDAKLKNLTEILISIKNTDSSICPDILVLEEIENSWVLKRWKDNFLQACGYAHIIVDNISPDVRGIRVAVMTKLEVASKPRSHLVYTGGRTVLETQLKIANSNLTVFANHWKSRLTRPGSNDNGEEKRNRYAQFIRKRIDAILEENPDEDIIVAGDLNDEPENKSMQSLGVAGQWRNLELSPILWQPSNELRAAPLLQDFETEEEKDTAFKRLRGTIYYRGAFFQFDHLLLSQGLFDAKGFQYQRRSFQVVRHPNYVNPKTKASLPFDSRDEALENERGPRGASDHFPVLLRLNVSHPDEESN